MNIIDRLDFESRSRVLTDEESDALADAVRREKITARRRFRYVERSVELNARKRDRYAADAVFRLRVLANNESSRKRNARRAIATVGLSRQAEEYVYMEKSI